MLVYPKFNFFSPFFLGDQPFWLVHQTKKNFGGSWKYWNFLLKDVIRPPLTNLYGWKWQNFGQSIWDKCVVLLGTSGESLGTLGIWWEHVENNTKVTNPSPSTPDPPKEKNLRASRVHYWLSRIFIPSLVCHHFQLRLMEWKGHMSAYWGIHLKVWWNNVNFAQKIPNEKDLKSLQFLDILKSPLPCL
jgi:hypothetical protein